MRAIDADAHVIESPMTWEYLDPAHRKFLPTVVSKSSGNDVRNVEGNLQQEYWVLAGRIHNKDRNVGSNTSEESREMRSIDARLAHMDELEVDVQVLFPTLLLRPVARHPHLEYALAHAYNRWLADIWKKAPKRLRWAAVAPLLSMDKLRDELRFAKDNGACGIFLRPLECELPLSDPYFFPLYEVATELDMPICIHLGNGSFDVHDFYDRDTAFTKFKMPTIGAFHSIIYNGIPSQFPKLRWGLIEASANWLPFIVSDLRQRYKKRGKQLPANILAANNMYVACEVSDDFNAVLPVAGEDNLVIGTDYGHNDNSSQIEALRMVRDAPGMNAKAIDKILWDNPRKLYGLT
jgi:uncharacterized protein